MSEVPLWNLLGDVLAGLAPDVDGPHQDLKHRETTGYEPFALHAPIQWTM